MALLAADVKRAQHDSQRRPRRRRSGPLDASWVTYTVLGIVFLVSVFPIYWTIVAASTSNTAINQIPPNLVPGGNLWSNFQKVMENDAGNMAVALRNSAIICTIVTLGTTMFGCLAGFAFAKLQFRGRNLLLGLVIATTMIPFQISSIPLLMIMVKFNLIDKTPAVFLPTLVTAFGVFFLRQYLVRALPDELIEAARVDGASFTRIFISIVLPVARPAMAVLGMLTFIFSWNDLFWPLLSMRGNPTVQVGIANLANSYTPDLSQVMAGTLIGTLPLILVFIVLGRQIVSGIMQGAIKG